MRGARSLFQSIQTQHLATKRGVLFFNPIIMKGLTEYVQEELNKHPELNGITVAELMRDEDPEGIVDAILLRARGKVEFFVQEPELPN